MSDRLYPGRWRALLVPLCAPSCTCDNPGKRPHSNAWQHQALARFDDYSERESEAHAVRVREHVRRGGNVGLALPPYTAALDVDTDLAGGADYRTALARDAILAICDDHPAQESGKTDDAGRRVGVHVLGACSDRRPYATHYGSVPVTVRGVGNQIAVASSDLRRLVELLVERENLIPDRTSTRGERWILANREHQHDDAEGTAAGGRYDDREEASA